MYLRLRGKRLRKIKIVLISFVSMMITVAWSGVFAEDYKTAPVDIQVPLFMKLLAFEQNISTGDVTIHVIGSTDFTVELKKVVGEKIGKGKLSSVSESGDLPADKPSAIYIGDEAKLDKILAYTKQNKVLSMTGIPDLVSRGVTLGIGVLAEKPKILLNIVSSKDEKATWNPAIMKVSTIVKSKK